MSTSCPITEIRPQSKYNDGFGRNDHHTDPNPDDVDEPWVGSKHTHKALRDSIFELNYSSIKNVLSGRGAERDGPAAAK